MQRDSSPRKYTRSHPTVTSSNSTLGDLYLALRLKNKNKHINYLVAKADQYSTTLNLHHDYRKMLNISQYQKGCFLIPLFINNVYASYIIMMGTSA